MPLLTLGINHRTAPVHLREQVAFAPDRMHDALHDLCGRGGIAEAVILSTCNRTEIYCHSRQADAEPVLQWLADFHQVSLEALGNCAYVYQDEETVRHILRVAAGLDSMILGEPQILGQIKAAYQAANDAGTVERFLNRLFQHTFAVAKQIRTDTAIGESPVSVAFAAVSLAHQIFGDFDQQTALLVGAGETIELTARHLKDHGIGRLIVANRTVERAHALAQQFAGYAIGLNEIPVHLVEADMVIASTASPDPILRRPEVEAALHRRKHRPMFMVDIAVPRDIEESVGELDDVYLYTVDDLEEVIQENLRSRQDAARQAEDIVDTQVARFMGWLRSLDAVELIRHFRGRAEMARDQVLEKARQQLRQGKDPEQVLLFLANTLTNKMLHTPSISLRRFSADGRVEALDIAREILGLPPAQGAAAEDDDGGR